MCFAKAAVAVNRKEHVQGKVCICCYSYSTEPVPKGFTRLGKTFGGDRVAEYGPHGSGAYVLVKEERGKSCW